MRRRATIGLLALVAWVAGTAFASVGPVVTARTQAGMIIGEAHANFAPSLTGSKPIVVLAIGSGSRPGEDVIHSLADSIHLIFLNPSTHKAAIVGVPRDSYVPIPGIGTNKINDAMVAGGPGLLVQTLESNFGVHIDYWALTTFGGLAQMINSIGGLTINVPFAMKDSYSGADFKKGKHHMTGPQVLAFSRDRHSLNSGDFGRSEDGGRVFLAALSQFKTEFAKDQARLFAWIAAGMRNMQTTLKLPELVDLAFTASHVALKDAQNVVLPGGSGMVGSISVVHIDTARARALIADAQKDGTISKANMPSSPTAGQT
jgi:polyisoprenyl-teichoic acid--peptidoglycan teichoic acid transferase